jgi:hypothetical protein
LTEPITAHESPEYDDHQSDQSMRLMKLLFVAVTVAAVAASVGVVMHIGDHSVASAPTVDAHPGACCDCCDPQRILAVFIQIALTVPENRR